MALKLYKDSACTQDVKTGAPESFQEAVTFQDDCVHVAQLWVKSDDSTITYEDITITASGDVDNPTTSGEIDVTFSLDNSTYSQSITLPNGDYTTPMGIWRKAYSPTVIGAFKTTSIIYQVITDEISK